MSHALLAPAPTCNVRTALVVDDYFDSAEVIAVMLKRLGYEVTIAGDGIEALRKATSLHPDLILMDISMPKLDGFDTCGVLRAQPWAEKIRLVAVTGFPEEIVRQRFRKAGFDGYILKPVELKDLERITGSKATR